MALSTARRAPISVRSAAYRSDAICESAVSSYRSATASTRRAGSPSWGRTGDAAGVEGGRAIIAEVRGRGDDALRDLTEQFDGCTIDDLRVPGDELLAALEDAPAEFRAALEYAREEVTAYHEA